MKFTTFAGACLAATITVAAGSAQAATISVSDSTFGTFDASRGTRDLNVVGGGIITDVNIFIDFAKCDDPAMASNAERCASDGEEFSGETFFYLLSPLGTRVDLVYTYNNVPEGVEGGSTLPNGTYDLTVNSGGRFQVLFDSDAALAAGPTMLGGTFRPAESLSLFNGEGAVGLWTLGMGDSIGADPLSYFSARLDITTDASAVPEPASLTLLGLGLLGAARKRFKK